MNVPREVILDLLPVYLAGETSPATRVWLEQQLSQDAELTELLRRHRATASPPLALPEVPPELALRALKRTRRLMILLRWLFGLAITFSAIAFSLEVDFNPVRVRLLMFDHPGSFGLSLLVGIALWIAYFVMRRRLRIPGV